MRRRIPVVLALVVALAALSAPLARADGGTVTIAPSDGGAARQLSLAALAAAGGFDVHDATYTLRAADGTTRTVTVSDGISLGALLSAAGLDGDPFTYVEVPRPDGTSTYVLSDHVGDAGNGPPVVWSDAQGVHFLRPSDGRGDANVDDDITFPDGALALDLHTGNPIEPRIHVSTVRARPHQAVRFSASLAAGTLAPGMAFQWYFDRGGLVLGATVTHRFPATGAFTVVLNVVRGPQDVTALAATVVVRVVAAAPRKRSGGAKSGGAAQGAVTGSGSGDAGSGGAGAAGGSGSGAGGAAGKRGAGAGGAAPPARPTTARVAPPPRRSVAALHRLPPPPQGQLVSGTLLASTSAALPLASGGARATSAAPGGAAADGPLHVPVGVWVAIGLAALLGLGWALESRHTLPFWQP